MKMIKKSTLRIMTLSLTTATVLMNSELILLFHQILMFNQINTLSLAVSIKRQEPDIKPNATMVKRARWWWLMRVIVFWAYQRSILAAVLNLRRMTTKMAIAHRVCKIKKTCAIIEMQMRSCPPTIWAILMTKCKFKVLLKTRETLLQKMKAQSKRCYADNFRKRVSNNNKEAKNSSNI